MLAGIRQSFERRLQPFVKTLHPAISAFIEARIANEDVVLESGQIGHNAVLKLAKSRYFRARLRAENIIINGRRQLKTRPSYTMKLISRRTSIERSNR